MTFTGKSLVIPEKNDSERDAVARAWASRGGDVVRLGRFWDPPDLAKSSVRLYGNDTFCLVLAEKLGLQLISPPDDFLVHLARPFTKRDVGACSIGELATAAFPLFVKPMVPKQFTAAVHPNLDSVRALTVGLSDDTLVCTSEVVSILGEVRGFVLRGDVLSAGVYEGTADPSEACSFLRQVAGEVELLTYALDVALTADRGWIVVEANAAWGAGLNGCDAASVLDSIDAATSCPEA